MIEYVISFEFMKDFNSFFNVTDILISILQLKSSMQ